MIFDVPCIRNMSLKFMHTNCDWDNPSTRQSCPDIDDEPVPEIDAAPVVAGFLSTLISFHWIGLIQLKVNPRCN